VLSWAASRRLPYRELEEEELRKVAGGAHHEGLVVIAKPLRYAAFTLEGAGAGAAGDPRHGSRSGPVEGPATPPIWVALDGVENPHNMGAVLRSCAFFGVAGLLAGGAAPGEKVNQAALRVAEGGAEYVRLAAAPDLAHALTALTAQGWAVLGLETDGTPLPQGRPPRALVLVLGQEHEGLRPAVRTACTGIHRLVGGGPLTSLNVSVAAGVALALLRSNI
jgi:TrmH RNA methyltransferase